MGNDGNASASACFALGEPVIEKLLVLIVVECLLPLLVVTLESICCELFVVFIFLEDWVSSSESSNAENAFALVKLGLIIVFAVDGVVEARLNNASSSFLCCAKTGQYFVVCPGSLQ